MKNIGVIGAGSWGTALALVLEKNGHQVTLWSSREEKPCYDVVISGR